MHAFGQLHPDVCVIDISMPYLNGIEAAIKLRESEFDGRIVFLTVNEDSDFVGAAAGRARLNLHRYCLDFIKALATSTACSRHTC